MDRQHFKHGRDNNKAREYLKEIGIYDEVVMNAKKNVFGNNYPVNDGFLMVLAANENYNKKNEIE